MSQQTMMPTAQQMLAQAMGVPQPMGMPQQMVLAQQMGMQQLNIQQMSHPEMLQQMGQPEVSPVGQPPQQFVNQFGGQPMSQWQHTGGFC